MILHNYFNNKQIKKYSKDIQTINAIYEKNKTLPEKNLASMLMNIKNGDLSNKQKIYQSIALAKEASEISLKMSYYDVQIMGALALIDGKISQMKTGEGKTLMCSAAVTANYALGFKTHVATANEYLAKRDEETMRPLYKLLDIKSGSNITGMSPEVKKEVYKSDVLYSTSQEMGFDYLRDNLVKHISDKIQPQDFFNIVAIIDEADFILIDEARTPLIISGSSTAEGSDFYKEVRDVSLNLEKMLTEPEKDITGEYMAAPGDFWVDYKTKSIHLSEQGYGKVEKLLFEKGLLKDSHHAALYKKENLWILDEVINALKAQYLFLIDKQYVVQNGEIVIVDENTGRLSLGRSWSDGLHQAIEAKENVQINSLTSTLRTISIQNYFRHYGKICGMTGTASVCAQEFQEIYNCPVVEIPTNRKMIRQDYSDKVFMEAQYKYNAIITDIEERHKKGQPILVGTTSVNESEIISQLLNEKNIFHYVLNAKNHALEAQIISQAGVYGAVTVATSMAGRGTDIILGGNKEEIIKIKNNQIDKLEEIKSYLINFLLYKNELSEGDNAFDVQAQDFSNMLYIQNFIDEVGRDLEVKDTNKLKSDLANLHLLQHLLAQEITHIEENWSLNREKAVASGGLCVIGCSRNESRRIDDQIRGRSGRQGDVGESVFYISFEDNWLKVFAKSSMFKILKNNLQPDEPITSSLITSSIQKAQKSIEAMYFDNRKNTFQYDSILNESRVNFFKIRDDMITDHQIIKNILLSDVKEKLSNIENMDYVLTQRVYVDNREDSITVLLDKIMDKDLELTKRKEIMLVIIKHVFNLSIQNAVKLMQIIEINQLWEKINTGEIKSDEDLKKIMEDGLVSYFALMQDDFWLWFKSQCVEDFDNNWINYLSITEDLRNSSGLSSLIQKNPLYEYRKSCYDLFKSFITDFKDTMLNGILEKMNFEESEKIA